MDDLISREAVKEKFPLMENGFGLINERLHKGIDELPSAFEGMTNNEVHKAIFGFELDPRYLVTEDTCICGENCPVCPLYNKTCNNKNFAEWLDSPYKGVSE